MHLFALTLLRRRNPKPLSVAIAWVFASLIIPNILKSLPIPKADRIHLPCSEYCNAKCAALVLNLRLQGNEVRVLRRVTISATVPTHCNKFALGVSAILYMQAGRLSIEVIEGFSLTLVGAVPISEVFNVTIAGFPILERQAVDATVGIAPTGTMFFDV